MENKLLLSIIVDALYHVSTTTEVYINLINNEIISIDDGMINAKKNEVLEKIEEKPEQYLHIPNQFELDGYNRMKRFIKTLGETKYIKEFENAIRGKGAFRRFKDLLIKYDIRDYWHEFQNSEYIKIAISLLESHNIEFFNDLEDDFDLRCEKEIEKNEQYLNMFKEDMLNEGLSEITIEKHINNMDDYLNGYLLHRDIITAIEGVKLSSGFFNSWYPRFLIPTNDQTNSFIASIKKFYKLFLEKELITAKEYDELLLTLEVCI